MNTLAQSACVSLRALTIEDIEKLREWRNDPNNSRYIRKIPHITKEGQLRWFNGILDRDDEITFAVDYEGNLAGSVSLYCIANSEAEFGRLLIGYPKGKRVGYHAAAACLEYAFATMKLNRLHATVTVNNTAALKIYVDLGFRIRTRQYNEDVGQDEFVIELDKDRYFALQSCQNKGDHK